MSPEILARLTTTALVLEALERFGPLSEKAVGEILDENRRTTGHAIGRLLLAKRVVTHRTAAYAVVLYAASGRSAS